MRRPFRCPILVAAALVGVSAVVAYYIWSRKNNKKGGECCSKNSDSCTSAASSDGSKSAESEPRTGAGMESSSCTDMFKFPDEHVRRVCERLFLEQMDLGEAYMEDEETIERGAMHLANAIALTGETEPLLKVLRKGMTPANFAVIQKYMPTAEVRVNQLLQDELTIESIAENFG